jgi:hypothetical protein
LDIDFSSQFDEDMAPLINEDNTLEATFELGFNSLDEAYAFFILQYYNCLRIWL